MLKLDLQLKDFITEYFCVGDSLELRSCKNGHHGHQGLGTVNKVNIFGFNLTPIEYLGKYMLSAHTQSFMSLVNCNTPSYMPFFLYNFITWFVG